MGPCGTVRIAHRILSLCPAEPGSDDGAWTKFSSEWTHLDPKNAILDLPEQMCVRRGGPFSFR